jgi:hypothetical protein
MQIALPHPLIMSIELHLYTCRLDIVQTKNTVSSSICYACTQRAFLTACRVLLLQEMWCINVSCIFTAVEKDSEESTSCFLYLTYQRIKHKKRKHTRGYPKIRGLFKYLLNVNVYCNENLSAYIVEYYQHNLKGTVNCVNK